MPSVWRTTFHSLNYSVQRGGLWIYPEKDIWYINQAEKNGVGKDIDKRVHGQGAEWGICTITSCLLSGLLGTLSTEVDFLLSCEGVISWPALTLARQFSALCLAWTTLWSFCIVILKDWAELLLYFFPSLLFCLILFTAIFMAHTSISNFWLQLVVLQSFENKMAQTYVIIY